MFGVHSPAASIPVPARDTDHQRVRAGASGAASTDRRTAPAISATICPHRFSRWAWGEGLRAGEAVALLVQDLGQAEAMRLGLTRLGLRVVSLDCAGREQALADALAQSAAVLVVVDTALADVYAGVMGRLCDYPALWWNGPGADFASLNLALAEQA
ncbi:AMP-dependent synthetase [Methylobacterium sp. P1-11]|nr:AMP-dependent synthetase [Methylobacterium sp. P1-11]